MKTKLVCLTLSILMLLSCLLTGCAEKKNEEGETEEVVDNSAKTIVMWVVTEEETDEAAMARVNEAFTKITKSKFKTNVVLKFCTEEEYYEKLEASINANQADILLKEEHDKARRVYLRTHKGEKTEAELLVDFYAENPKYAKFQNIAEEDDEEVTVGEDETVVNDYGIVEIKYPDAKENQVDIFYLTGYDKYMEYYSNEWLASLNEELKTSSKKITHYVSKSLLDGVQIDGQVYAIPNNVAIGEYTYMMIDKLLFDKYYQKIDNVQSVLDLGSFLNDITKENGDLTPEDEGYIVPLASTFEECMSSLVWYWEMFYTDKSVYETKLDANGRNYVVNKFYEVKEEAVEEGQEAKIKVYSTADVMQDMVYKTNAQGKFVDKAGNVLDYTYVQDSSMAWYSSVDKDGNRVLEVHFPTSVEPSKDKAGVYTLEADSIFTYATKPDGSQNKTKLLYDGFAVVFDKEVKGMYLVDGEGNPVTPANDKRVAVVNSAYEPLMGENDKYDLEEESIFTMDAEGELYLNGCAVVFDDNVTTGQDAYGNHKATYYYGYEKSPNFSVLGALQTNPAKRTRGGITLGFNSLFTQSNYRDLLSTLLGYQYNGYYGEVGEGQSAAVSFVKGDARIKLAYEENGVYVDPTTGREYYAMVAAYPEATEDELYGNMFAVYANSNNIARSMKVITYLNTNAEFRNLLQYGIEGHHYEIDKVTEKDELGNEIVKQTVRLLNGTPYDPDLKDDPDTEEDESFQYGVYRMDIRKTGNCFIATPTAEMGGANAWDYAKIQNNDSLVNPLMGLDFNLMLADSDYGLDVELIYHMNQLSEATWLKVQDCRNLDELIELMETDTNALMKSLAASSGDAKLKKAINGAYDPSMPIPDAGTEQPADLSGHSPYKIYMDWLNQYGYAP